MTQDNALALVKTIAPELTSALGKGLKAKQFAQFALTAFRLDEKLQQSSRESLVASLLTAAQEDGQIGFDCWVLPFWNKRANCYEATLVRGYQLLVKHAYNHPRVAGVMAHAVSIEDEFKATFGTDPYIQHERRGPAPTDPAEVKCYYAVVMLRDGAAPLFEVMYPEEIEAVRRRSASNKPGGPWTTDYIAMARKTVVKRVLKLAPKSTTLLGIMQNEAMVDVGEAPLKLPTAENPNPPPLASPPVEGPPSGGEGQEGGQPSSAPPPKQIEEPAPAHAGASEPQGEDPAGGSGTSATAAPTDASAEANQGSEPASSSEPDDLMDLMG